MSTGMNFTCISAFDASKDIIWSFSYKFESNSGVLGNCGFTTFLNFLSAQTKGGINSGLGYGPYDDGIETYEGVDENFLAISLENAGMFGMQGNGFSTGLNEPIYNSISVRKNNNFEYVSTKAVDFNIASDDWQTLRFQLTNLGHTLNVFYCDKNYNYIKVATFETSDIFYISQQLYIGISFATPIDSSSDFKLRIKNFHFYGQAPNILPPVIEEQTKEEFLLFGNTVLLSTKVVGARPLRFEWYKDSDIIPDETNTLYYASDIGTYKFRAYNSAGYSTSKNILVKEATIPEFVLDLDSTYTIPPTSDNIVLSVSAIAAPDPSYRWYKNNIIISSAKTHTITAYDIGNYIAVAYNKFGEVSSTEASILMVLPVAMPDPVSGAAPLAIEAKATGSLPITYKWFRNGVEIPDSNYDIYNAETPGNYFVEVSNKAGTTRSYVISAFILPVFIIQPKNAIVGVDTITVSAVGTEPILYSWYKDDNLLPGVTGNTHTPDSVGVYKAVATNILGPVESYESIVLAEAGLQIVDFWGPKCLDNILPIDPVDNEFDITFDRPVSLNSSFTKAFTAAGITISKIISTNPPVGGRYTNYKIQTTPKKASYGILEDKASNFKPIPYGNPMIEVADVITLPFPIKDSLGKTHTQLFVGDKSFLSFTTNKPGSFLRNGYFTIAVNANNNNKLKNFSYYIPDENHFCIGWLGVYNDSAPAAEKKEFQWKITFYKNYPERFTIDTNPSRWATGAGRLSGTSICQDAGGVPLAKIPIDSNKSITLDQGYNVVIPPNAASTESGLTNTDSKAIFVKNCKEIFDIANVENTKLLDRSQYDILVNDDLNLVVGINSFYDATYDKMNAQYQKLLDSGNEAAADSYFDNKIMKYDNVQYYTGIAESYSKRTTSTRSGTTIENKTSWNFNNSLEGAKGQTLGNLGSDMSRDGKVMVSSALRKWDDTDNISFITYSIANDGKLKKVNTFNDTSGTIFLNKDGTILLSESNITKIYKRSGDGWKPFYEKLSTTTNNYLNPYTNELISSTRDTSGKINIHITNIPDGPAKITELPSPTPIDDSIGDITQYVSAITYSGNGNVIAICTSKRPNNINNIYIYKKIGSTWTKLGNLISFYEQSLRDNEFFKLNYEGNVIVVKSNGNKRLSKYELKGNVWVKTLFLRSIEIFNSNVDDTMVIGGLSKEGDSVLVFQNSDAVLVNLKT